uniref:Uncharacterized protein n=1 Tax=Haptolina ericina TaxID=156174 RepID=A0A7S3B9I5_9EUKA|mmetsp:Transcript_54649/g.122287  ORF Transcript_54649/g.122287 Transcript_54649/m.122287 type:complete len:325 (+) Transcript_54649:59-1033(+)
MFVKEHEAAQRFRYTWVVRVDCYFFGTAPAHCSLRAGHVAIPAGVVGCCYHRKHPTNANEYNARLTDMCDAVCANDHMAFVPREFADDYFELSRDIELCSDVAGKHFRNFTDDGGRFLWWRMVHKGVRMGPSPIVPYTLLRNCQTAAGEEHRQTNDTSSRGMPFKVWPECDRWNSASAHTGVPHLSRAMTSHLRTQCLDSWVRAVQENTSVCQESAKPINGHGNAFSAIPNKATSSLGKGKRAATEGHNQRKPQSLLKRIVSNLGAATHPALPLGEVRRLNLIMCPHELTDQARHEFGVDPATLPLGATVHVCQHRRGPEGGGR